MDQRTLCIVGLGLMGGSFALALRTSGYPGRLIGVSRSAETLRYAQAQGIVDLATDDLGAAREAEVVVLCTPARTIIAQIGQLASICKPGAILTDMGSTKVKIARAMDALPGHLRAVAAHPMCGKEAAGIQAADAGLFRGAPWLIIPTARTDDEALSVVRALAERVGASPRILDADQHDALLAFASHLPYALAVALVAATEQFSLNHPEVWGGHGRRISRHLAGRRQRRDDVVGYPPHERRACVGRGAGRPVCPRSVHSAPGAARRSRTAGFLTGCCSGAQGALSMNRSLFPARTLSGLLRVPSDRSITVRALLLAGLAEDTSRVLCPLESEDTEAARGLHGCAGRADRHSA
jgi:prephenate dehydrogenase